MHDFLPLFGTGMGIASAVFWFWSAFASVTREQAVERRKKLAARRGVEPDLGGVSFGGNDLQATTNFQSSLNAAAAALSGLAVLAQAAANYVK